MRPVLLLLFVTLVWVPRAAWPQGMPLGPEFRVNTYTTGFQGEPSVAADSSGNFVIVWQSYPQDSETGVFGQRYAGSGTPLGPEFRVNTYTTSSQGAPSVTADASGNFVVAWQSYIQDGSATGVFGQRYAGSGTPLGPEFRVSTYAPGNQNYPSVAADSAGNFVVVWQSEAQDGSAFGVFGQRYASSGTPLGPEFRVNTYTTGSEAFPSIASDLAGNFVVVWLSDTQDGSAFGVFGQRYASTGTPLGPEFRVNTYTTGYQSSPSVAVDASGNFVVVWGSSPQDGSGAGVFGQRYASTGVPLGPEFRVNTYTTGYQYRPSISADASGNFVVIWPGNRPDDPNYGLFGQRYSSSGAPLGSEFLVNTYTTGTQNAPSVAADPSGDFVVVWRSNAQDGAGFGIFGQRYGQIVPVELFRFNVE